MKKLIYPTLIFVIITIIFTFPICLRMNSAVYGPLQGTDSRGTIWQLWWGKYSFDQKLNYTFHSTVAAPFGNDVSGFPQGFLWSLLIRWLPVVTGEIFAYNLVIVASFILSSLFVYLITYSITHHRAASIISGLIFGFCPYHFQRSWEHFSLAQIQWPALYLLALFKIVSEPSRKNLLFFVLAASIVLHLEFNYFYIVSILSVMIILFVYLENIFENLLLRGRNVGNFLKKIKENSKFVLYLITAAILFIAVNLPLFLSIFNATTNPTITRNASVGLIQRPFHYLFTQSARILCYFIPSSANPLLGGLAKALEGSIFYGRGPIEQTLYLGWIPIILTWIAWKKRKLIASAEHGGTDTLFYIKLLTFLAIVAFIFSMPPFINLGLFKIYFPSFFLYKLVPAFRAYARFGLFVILSVSILAGIGFKFILTKFNLKKQRIILILSMLFILFEFNNIPPLRYVNADSAPPVYAWLSKQKGDFIVAEYPLGEAASGETYVELDYLLNQRIHNKRLFNGIAPGTFAFSLKERAMRIDKPQTAFLLSSLGVKYVILHLDRYREGTNVKAVDSIGEVPDLHSNPDFKFIQSFGNDEVYEVIIKTNKNGRFNL